MTVESGCTLISTVMSPTSTSNLPSPSSKTQNLQRSLSTATLHPTSPQTKMPIRLFPANRVLSSTHRGLSTLLTELRAVDSDQTKSRNSLTHIRLRFDLLVDAFEDEKLRLSKKAFTRILYRRDIQNVEKHIVVVRRDMDKTNRDIECGAGGVWFGVGDYGEVTVYAGERELGLLVELRTPYISILFGIKALQDIHTFFRRDIGQS
ncbi:uncharacterized protein LAJ45_10584 [Morchella importuna]|uniref:uncharacterized protein n=1 Tax=Morchella importuna TaxID=1174673 RepID=UPI001E8CF5B4|nr:uncharacterized protein LAJ45_10584 [Morchella importuna]KAH8145304.1 hypothetical protein LAJ45_10584 [Morchella importuna]